LKYRLALDVGTNSIGYCLLELDNKLKPYRIIRLGSRIYSDGRNPKDGSSLAAMRREPRQQRRRRDRFLRRQKSLLKALVKYGLMPEGKKERKALEVLDPYRLRAKGLDEALSPFELGRAIFHLNQRRGFASNRKTDAGDDKEAGKIKTAVTRLREQMHDHDARTIGEFFYQRQLSHLSIRSRLHGQGARAYYDFYPHRDLIAEEFDSLWEAQADHYPEVMTEDAYHEIRDILLYQRPLRPVDPGRCTFEPDEPRAPSAHPLAQKFRLLQEVNHLRVVMPDQCQRLLTLDERNKLYEALSVKKKMAYSSMRKAIKLPRGSYFTHESEYRKDLAGHETNAILGSKKAIGVAWFDLAEDKQIQIVQRLLDEPDEDRLRDFLTEVLSGLDDERLAYVMKASLPDGYMRLSLKAVERITPMLEADVITYDEAVRKAGYPNHSQLHTGEIFDNLPYYGQILERHVAFGSNNPEDDDEVRYGRIANPTVHVGLNQIRKMLNALIRRYGRPEQISVELARDLKASQRQRDRYRQEQNRNKDRNEKFVRELEELGHPNNGENRLRLRLWEELNPGDPLDRRCVFTGKAISPSRLFSSEVEIEHLLPFSRSLDDSIANKTVCLRTANRDKAGKTPFEAFGHSPGRYRWDEILKRVEGMPANKRWRFAEQAMTVFDEEGDFLARQLNETRYLSRLVKGYLGYVCPPNEIRVLPGRLTALLRGKWGLSKSRDDHRHHALDAAVIGTTDMGMLKRVATAAARAEEKGIERVLQDMPLPWDGFREEVQRHLSRMVVSHKPDHGPQAALHNDTAYGIVDGPDPRGVYEVVHRIPVNAIAKLADVEKIRDILIRQNLAEILRHASDKKSFSAALEQFSAQSGVRHIRILEKLSVIPIADKAGRPYKAYKGDSNYCYEIYQDEKGRWKGELVTSFEANQKPYRDFMLDKNRYRTQTFRGHPMVMRVCQNDMIAIELDGKVSIMRVMQLTKGKVVMAEHYQGGDLRARNKNHDDGFKNLIKSPDKLRQIKARRVFVDILGRVKDPGYRSCQEELSK